MIRVARFPQDGGYCGCCEHSWQSRSDVSVLGVRVASLMESCQCEWLYIDANMEELTGSGFRGWVRRSMGN